MPINPNEFSEAEILKMKENAGKVFTSTGERVDSSVPASPNEVGGLRITNANNALPGTSQWAGSAPRVSAPGTAQKVDKIRFNGSDGTKVTAPSSRLQEKFKEMERADAAKHLVELAQAEEAAEAKEMAANLPDFVKRQDRLISSLSKKIAKLEKQLQHMEGSDS